ncbi:hypothetical protein ACFX2B_024174 [Malus domestica]
MDARIQRWHLPKMKPKEATRQRWVRPNDGWIKCNFDGSWNERPKIGGFGVIIRDHRGEFTAATSLQGGIQQ